MGKVDTIAFDKTGTLTYGKLEVSDILSFDHNLDRDHLLTLAASAEAKSEHPLGKAIFSYAKEKNITVVDSENFQMIADKGIYAEVSKEKLLCGNEKYLLDNGICIGVLALSDMIRPTTREMVERLSAMDTKTVLLTGDNQKTAAYFAKQVGITEIHTELLPEQKVENIYPCKTKEIMCV